MVTVTEEARGSQDTLHREGQGRLPRERRGHAPRRDPRRADGPRHAPHRRLQAATTRTVRSQWWSVDLKSTHSGSAGAAGVLLDMMLRNEETGREAHVYVPTGGGSTPGPSTSRFYGGTPPTDVYTVPPSVDWVPYDTRTRTGDAWIARFAIGQHGLTPAERRQLRGFVSEMALRLRDH